MGSGYVMLVVFCVAAGVTTFAIPIILCLSKRFSLYAPITQRSVHTKPLSQLGGVGIFAGFVLAIAISWLFTETSELVRDEYENMRLILLLVGAVMLWVVCLLDDLWDLPASFRLVWQFVCALVAVGPYLWEQQLYGPNDQ